MSIGICHLWIAAKYFGKNLKFTVDKEASEKSPAGYYYIVSLIINE
jgi:hypothetical protein